MEVLFHVGQGFTHGQYGVYRTEVTTTPLSIPVARAVKKTIEGDESTWSTLDSQCIFSENPESCQVNTKLRSETLFSDHTGHLGHL